LTLGVLGFFIGPSRDFYFLVTTLVPAQQVVEVEQIQCKILNSMFPESGDSAQLLSRLI